MAVGRVELSIPEFEGILARLGDIQKGHDLWRAKRELKRGLDRALQSDQADRDNIARLRADREARMPQMNEAPLTPHSMTVRGWRREHETPDD